MIIQAQVLGMKNRAERLRGGFARFFVWKVGDRKQKASIDIEEDFLTGDVLASYRDLYQEFAIGFSGDVKFAVGHEQHVVVENTGIVVGYKGTAAADLPIYRTIGAV